MTEGYAPNTFLNSTLFIDKTEKKDFILPAQIVFTVVGDRKDLDAVATNLDAGMPEAGHAMINQITADGLTPELRVSVSIPDADDYDKTPITDATTKFLDVSQTGLAYDMHVSAIKNGSKFLPHIRLTLQSDCYPPHDIATRAITEVLKKRLHQQNATGPFNHYEMHHEPGTPTLTFTGTHEICNTAAETFPYNMAFASHLQHKSHPHLHDIRLRDVYLSPADENVVDDNNQPIRDIEVTLEGDTKQLKAAATRLRKDPSLTPILHMPEEGTTDPARLTIQSHFANLDQLAEVIRVVHLNSYCQLPINLLPASIPTDAIIDSENPPLENQVSPSTLVTIDDNNVSEDTRHALTVYLGAYIRDMLAYITLSDADEALGPGSPMVIMRPGERYTDPDEVVARATQMTDRLKRLMTYDGPAPDRGRA